MATSAGRSSLKPDAGMLEELVVEHRPQQFAHAFGRAVDEVRLVDPIDGDDDAGESERLQDRLELGQELVAVVAAVLHGDGLAAELLALELRQDAAERVGQVIEDADFPRGPPRRPQQPDLPEEPGKPAGDDDRRHPPLPEELLPTRETDDQADRRDRDDEAQEHVPLARHVENRRARRRAFQRERGGRS